MQLSDEPTEVISPEVLDRMTEVIRHRGPDDVGTYAAPGIAIGVRRLEHRRRRGGSPAVPERRRLRSGRHRTVSSTSMPRSEIDSAPTGTASRVAATPRSSRTSTRRTGTTSRRGFAGCSGSSCGTRRGVARSLRATGWASSPSTIRPPATGSCSRRSSRACSRPGSSTSSSTMPRSTRI